MIFEQDEARLPQQYHWFRGQFPKLNNREFILANREFSAAYQGRQCAEQGRRVIFVEVSPQPNSHEVWGAMEAIREGFACGESE